MNLKKITMNERNSNIECMISTYISLSAKIHTTIASQRMISRTCCPHFVGIPLPGCNGGRVSGLQQSCTCNWYDI